MQQFLKNLHISLYNNGFYNIENSFLYSKQDGINLYVVAVISDVNKSYDDIISKVDETLNNFYKNTRLNKIYLLNLIIQNNFDDLDMKIFEKNLDFEKGILQVCWGYSINDNKVIINKNQPDNFFGVEKILKNINKEDVKIKNNIEVSPKTKPYLTYSLIAIMSFIHLFKVIYPYLNYNFNSNYLTLNFGIYKDILYNKEYYRLLTYIFIHGSFSHLISNIIGLIIFGDIVERYFGKISFLSIFFIGGIFAGIFSIIFNGGYAIGASGAIFALEGAVLYFTYKERKTLNDINFNIVLVISIIGIAYGFTQSNIDNAGHIGGFIVGIIMGIIYHYIWVKKYDK